MTKYRDAGGDPEDLWDFGTIRNGARGGTVGRSAVNPIQVSGPPLTWENNGGSTGTSRSRGSGSSGGSMRSMKKNTDLPPLPAPDGSPSKRSDHQTTVRGAPVPGGGVDQNTPVAKRAVQREPSDEFEDYGDTYPSRNAILEEARGEVPLEDELPDTTMLDSVILPAIASVSMLLCAVLYHCTNAYQAIPTGIHPRSTNCPQCAPASIHRR